MYLCSTERWFMVKVLLCSNLQEEQTFYRRGLSRSTLFIGGDWTGANFLSEGTEQEQTFYRRGLGIKNVLHTRLMYNVQCTRTVQTFISFPSNKILSYWLHIFLFLWKVGKEFFSFCLKSKFWELFELSIKKNSSEVSLPPSSHTL